MAVALTLRLDDTTETRVAALAAQVAGPATDDPPHVTLAVLPDGADAPAALATASHLVARTPVPPITLASLGLFPGPQPVLFLAPVVTAALLACHADAMARLPRDAVHPHSRAGTGFPMVTLATGPVEAPALLAALEAAQLPMTAALERLGVVRFPPACILSNTLLPTG